MKKYAGITTKSDAVQSLTFNWYKPIRGVDTEQFLKLTVRHYLGYWFGVILYDDIKHARGYLHNDVTDAHVIYNSQHVKYIRTEMQTYVEQYIIATETARNYAFYASVGV